MSVERRKRIEVERGLELKTYPRDEVMNEFGVLLNECLGEDENLTPIKISKGRGEFSVACMNLAKQRGLTPVEAAGQLAADLNRKNRRPDYVQFKAEGPYVNLYLNWEIQAPKIIDSILEGGHFYGSENLGLGRRVVIDYSSPNIAKPFSVGHLRSTIIGDALARMYEFTGYDVIRDNHLGDWGTQFGYLIWAIKEAGDEEVIAGNPIEELQKLYVMANQRAETDETVKSAARSWFLKLEQGDTEARRLWQKCVEWSMIEFNRIYQRLGIEFDLTLGESFYEGVLAKLVNDLKKSGLLSENKGALVVDLEDAGLGKPVVLKGDGATVYMTRDIATGIYRAKELRAEKMIYVVGEDQKLYFRQFFEVMKRLGFSDLANQCQHVYFGMITLPEGRMSTRKGRVVYLEDVLNEAVKKAGELVDNSERIPDAEKAGVAEQIAVGAIKWFDLKADPTRSIVFNWSEVLNMEGNSGPYMQYTLTRTRSLLAKAEEFGGFDPGEVGGYAASEIELLKQVSEFPMAIRQAAESYQPSVIAQYLFQLAKEFNAFYQKEPILTEDIKTRNRRLLVVLSVARVLANGLYLLGIPAPEKM